MNWDEFIKFVGQVSGALVIFTISQALAKAIIDPLMEVRKVKGRIAHAVLHYTDHYRSPGIRDGESREAAREALRYLGSEIVAAWAMVPFRKCLAILRFIPDVESVFMVRKNLIGLSNSLGPTEYVEQMRDDNHRRVIEILGALGWKERTTDLAHDDPVGRG